MRSRFVFAVPALLLAVPLAAQSGAAATTTPVPRLDSAATIATGRKYTEWFYSGMGDSLFAHSSAQVREKITAQQLSEIQDQLAVQVGNEAEVLSERFVTRDTLTAYLREARFELMEEPLVLAFTLDGHGKIYGCFIRPKSQVPADTAN
jgi:hypothetical protein